MRAIADDPERCRAFVAAVDAQLAAGNPDAYLRAFEHGYGRPPQALDLKVKKPLVSYLVAPPGAIPPPQRGEDTE